MSRHQHHHRPHKSSPEVGSSKKKLYRHWLFVLGVILMILAMLVYVLTMDDSIVPAPGEMPVEQAADI